MSVLSPLNFHIHRNEKKKKLDEGEEGKRDKRMEDGKNYERKYRSNIS